MSLNNETAWILKTTTTIGLIVMAAGLLMSSFEFSGTVISAGILILLFAPVLGIGVSTKCLIQEKDRYWVRIAILLIIILTAGALISYFL